MNALDAETLQLLGAHLQAFETDDALRVAILTGAGEKAFCAGADLKKKVAAAWRNCGVASASISAPAGRL